MLGIAALTPTYMASVLAGGNVGAKASGLDQGWVNIHRAV